MAFSFSKLLTDIIAFPSKPGSGALARKQFQDMFDEVAAGINANTNKQTVRTSRPLNITGNQVITLGFRPKLVCIRAMIDDAPKYDSDGSFDGIALQCLAKNGNGINALATANYLVYLYSDAGSNMATPTFTSTGLTLAWTTSGALSGTGAIEMKIEAFS